MLKIEKKKAHQTYQLADGTRVPGASTIAKVAGAYDSQGVLMAWANKQGLDGNDIANVSREAMSVGTIAHFLTDRWIDKHPYDLSNCAPEEVSKAESAAIKFGAWWDAGKYESVANEEQMVSEDMRCGGTLDNVIRDPEGRLWLIDKKTSTGIYREAWYQVAGLRTMWQHIHGTPIHGCMIVRIGKEDAMDDFEVQCKEDTHKYLAVFKLAAKLYHALKGCK